MTTIFDTYARLKDAFENDPESLQRIVDEEDRVKQLLATKAYALLPETKRLITLCRNAIVTVRHQLATNRLLDDAARTFLWAEIDAHKWFLDLVAVDVDAELKQIEAELEAELARL